MIEIFPACKWGSDGALRHVSDEDINWYLTGNIQITDAKRITSFVKHVRTCRTCRERVDDMEKVYYLPLSLWPSTRGSHVINGGIDDGDSNSWHNTIRIVEGD